MLSMHHHRLVHFTSPYIRNFWRCFFAVRSSVSGNQTKKRGLRETVTFGGDRRLRTSKESVVTFVGGKKRCASTLRTETSTRHPLGDDQKERIETLRDKCENGKD